MNEKIKRLRKALGRKEQEKERSVGGYLLLNLGSSNDANQRYLTGFDSTLGCLLVWEEGLVFFTDSRYIEAAEEELEDFAVEQIDSRPVKTVSRFIENLRLDTIAIDPGSLSLKVFNKLNGFLDNADLVQVEGVLRDIRLRKQDHELDLHKKAAEIADEAYDHLREILEVGLTEREIALELEFYMRQLGAEAVSFPPIVASGPNSAVPHAQAGDRELREGELLLVDMGARFEGYCSDLTRTLYLGNPPRKVKEIYQLVLEAHNAGLDAVESGVSGKEVHELARKVIEQKGYGDYFGHGLGHGVGLEVHEGPRLSETSEDTLAEGMVLTVEPGIYIPDWGGIRIEDMIRVTTEGCESFSTSPKKRIINPLGPNL